MAAEEPKPAYRRRLKRLLLGLLFLGGTGAAISQLEIAVDTAWLETWPPIEYVRVEGPIWNLDAEAFRSSLAPFVRNGYFRIDLDGVESAARRFGWVSHAEVERIWPDTLVVWIEEQQPIARWGQDSLLNPKGERFTPEHVASFEHLPLLLGSVGHEQELLAMLRALDRKLAARAIRISRLSLSKRLAWMAETTDGMEIVFGHQDPLAALDRLLVLLPKLGEHRLAGIRTLDLRYPNGFSVVWKPEAPLRPEQETDLKTRSSNG